MVDERLRLEIGQTSQPDAIPAALAQELTRIKGTITSAEFAGFAGLGGAMGFMTGVVLRGKDFINPELLDKALWAMVAVTAVAFFDGGVQAWRIDRQRGRIRPLAAQAITDEGKQLESALLASPLYQPEIQASSSRLAELAATTQGLFDNPNEAWFLAIGAIDQAHQAFVEKIIPSES